MDPDGKVAIVTGGAAGIGRATAELLARQGAAVLIADIDETQGREGVAAIAAAGGRAGFVRADSGVEADIRELIGAAEREFGRLDVLVNNAGVIEALTTQRSSFPDIQPERWLRMVDINLRGVLLGTHYAIEAMRKRGGGGAIVNVSSAAGIGMGPHGAPVYAASKAAVARFSAALGWLAARDGIRVNAICPGWVDTPMSRRGRAEMSAEEWNAIAPAVMLGADEVAASILELIKDETLAGRVMLHLEDAPPRLLRVSEGTSVAPVPGASSEETYR
jgi:NAD(P)-dependent dehydrogenase (short-subunit alcohol dehydrogenase family)